MKRVLWLGFVLCLYLICTGCGETCRPIIIPNPPVFPNPRAAHTVLAINDTGPVVPGSAMVVDVSGDTDMSVANVGLAPVHAAQQSASQGLVLNPSVTGAVADSITMLSFSSVIISGTTTISLPPDSAPNFVATTESRQAYVLLPNYAPPSFGVVSTVSNNLGPIVPVGNNPVAMVETANSQKLYVANQGDSTISGFNTVDRTPRVGSPVSTTSPPIWLSARSDSQRVYVLEGNGTLASLDTTSTAGPDTLTESAITVPGATKMVYDGNLNRLYIPGETVVQVNGAGVLESAVMIADVSQSAPSPIATIPIAAVQPSSRGASDPCSGTAITTLNTVDVAALPDGSRAYVGSYYEALVNNVEYFCPQVTVIDTASNTIKSSIAVPGFTAYDAFCSPSQSQRAPRFRIMMAAGGDSTRAYLSSCDGGNVNIIDTSNDTSLENLPAPIGSRPPIPPDQQNPPT